MSELRTRMIRDMTLRGSSPRTHEADIGAVVGLAKHYRRSPDQIRSGEEPWSPESSSPSTKPRQLHTSPT